MSLLRSDEEEALDREQEAAHWRAWSAAHPNGQGGHCLALLLLGVGLLAALPLWRWL